MAVTYRKLSDKLTLISGRYLSKTELRHKVLEIVKTLYNTGHTHRVNTPLTAENEGQISRGSTD